jgi:phosphoribosylanthranilate isomerase
MPLDVKICGLREPEHVAAAVNGGASHVGFIFFDKSPRKVSISQARDLLDSVRGHVLGVAVTVDATDAFLDGLVEGMKPSILQLHGNETPLRVNELKARYGLPVMKALSIRERGDIRAALPYIGIADRFLFDAKPPKGADLPGGNGIAFDWSLLDGLDDGLDYMLSGGVNAANVADAVRHTRATGLDVSSGVETAPGVKDGGLIREFLARVRKAEQEGAPSARMSKVGSA